jgi:DNA-binding IclR family transcriptional regulator
VLLEEQFQVYLSINFFYRHKNIINVPIIGIFDGLKMTSVSLNAVRALDILLLLGEAGPDGLTLAQITKQAGDGKSAIHRSLTSLVQKGFVEQTQQRGGYRLGPTIAMLARTQVDLEKQIQRFLPGMTEFARLTGFTVYLMVQAGVDAVCADMVSRSVGKQLNLGVGGRVPMGVAAGSLALLAMLPEDTAEEIMQANAARYLNTAALRELNKDIVAVKRKMAIARGFAINMGYYHPGEGGLGLPIRAKGHHDINVAVSFNAPLEMMTDEWMDDVIEKLKVCLGQADNG